MKTAGGGGSSRASTGSVLERLEQMDRQHEEHAQRQIAHEREMAAAFSGIYERLGQVERLLGIGPPTDTKPMATLEPLQFAERDLAQELTPRTGEISEGGLSLRSFVEESFAEIRHELAPLREQGQGIKRAKDDAERRQKKAAARRAARARKRLDVKTGAGLSAKR